MPSPTTASGLLRHFLRGADPSATDQYVTTPPVWLPTYSSLRAILAARDGGRGARGGANGRKGPREEGGEKIWRRREERGRNRADVWRDGNREEDGGREEEDDNRAGVRKTGPVTVTGKQ